MTAVTKVQPFGITCENKKSEVRSTSKIYFHCIRYMEINGIQSIAYDIEQTRDAEQFERDNLFMKYMGSYFKSIGREKKRIDAETQLKKDREAYASVRHVLSQDLKYSHRDGMLNKLQLYKKHLKPIVSRSYYDTKIENIKKYEKSIYMKYDEVHERKKRLQKNLFLLGININTIKIVRCDEEPTQESNKDIFLRYDKILQIYNRIMTQAHGLPYLERCAGRVIHECGIEGDLTTSNEHLLKISGSHEIQNLYHVASIIYYEFKGITDEATKKELFAKLFGRWGKRHNTTHVISATNLQTLLFMVFSFYDYETHHIGGFGKCRKCSAKHVHKEDGCEVSRDGNKKCMVPYNLMNHLLKIHRMIESFA